MSDVVNIRPPVDFQWKYASGVLHDDAGVMYGVSAAYFGDGQPLLLVHLGLTRVAKDGTDYHYHCENVLQGMDGGKIDVTTDWGGVKIEFSDDPSLWTHFGVLERPRESSSDHSVAPRVGAKGRIWVDGTVVDVTGVLWLESERGKMADGMKWTWASLRMKTGRSVLAYRIENKTFGWCWSDTDDKKGWPVTVTVEPKWPGWSVSVGTEAFDVLPVTSDQRIRDFAVSGMEYTEALCVVEDSTGAVGLAYVEDVERDWGRMFRPEPWTIAQKQMFLRWANGDRAAARLLFDLYEVSQISDDFVDDEVKGDKSKAMSKILTLSFIDMPKNPFYRQHSNTINFALEDALQQWEASNRLAESTNKNDRIFAYVHRESMTHVIWVVSFLCGGREHARRVLTEMHALYHGPHGVEAFEDWEKQAMEVKDGR